VKPKQTTVRTSTGNVFADLGLRNAADLSIQAELTRLIYLRIKELDLTQAQAAVRLGIRQPDVSKLMNGRHTGFSAERLFRFLAALGQDVQIVVRNRPARSRLPATVRVVAA
jgi:predicted XRE-type DNA-binding protein